MTYPNKWTGVSATRPNPDVFRAPDGADWNSLLLENKVPATAKSIVRDVEGMSMLEGVPDVIRLTLNTDVAMVDAGAAGAHGSVQLLDLNNEAYIVLAVSYDLDLTSDSIAAGTFDVGIGSTAVAVDNDVLATTEQDIMTKEDGEFSSNTDNIAGSDLTAKQVAAGAFLNIAIEEDDSDDDSVVTVAGTITLVLLKV